MKKLFFSAIPICLVSFILFGISVAFFGTKTRSHTSNVPDEHYGITYVDEMVTDSERWQFDAEPNIELRTSGVNAYIIQSNDENVHLQVNSHGGKKIAVSAVQDSSLNTLKLEIHPPVIVFGGVFNFGQFSWLDDIFNDSPTAEVIIAFPMLIYDTLDIMHGSGTLMADGLNAVVNNIHIGSGVFEFSKSEKYTASCFNVQLGSGKAVIANMQTKVYEIDIGSGVFDFSGLTGSGSINMGSGKGSIAYADNAVGQDYEYGGREFDGDLNIGSGSLTLYFPDEGGLTLSAGIGSGSVDIDAFDIKRTLTHGSDDDSVLLGNAEGFFDVIMGSGKVYIRNTSGYTAPEMFADRPFDVDKMLSQITITDVVSADKIASDFPSADEGTAESSVEAAETAVPGSVPKAPEAPNPPEAPESPTF